MEALSDKLLIQSYATAKTLKFSKDFIALLEKEMEQRALTAKMWCTKDADLLIN